MLKWYFIFVCITAPQSITTCTIIIARLNWDSHLNEISCKLQYIAMNREKYKIDNSCAAMKFNLHDFSCWSKLGLSDIGWVIFLMNRWSWGQCVLEWKPRVRRSNVGGLWTKWNNLVKVVESNECATGTYYPHCPTFGSLLVCSAIFFSLTMMMVIIQRLCQFRNMFLELS